jgi:aspartate racemase
MKTIGLIGGFSWHSTQIYYQKLNEEINNELGGFHSAKIILQSVNFQETKNLQLEGNWKVLENKIGEIAQNLENSGADCILICANTMHKTASYVQRQIKIPILHIAQCVADEIKRKGISKVSLIGTKETMTSNFYTRILNKNNIEVLIPEEIDFIDDKIFSELVFGKFEEETQQGFLKIINQQLEKGSEGIIYGCTEIPLLMNSVKIDVQSFDTLDIHVKAAVDFALE